MLRILLAVLVVYTPNQIHFPSDLGLPGLNVVNLLFLFALLFLVTAGRWGGLAPPQLGPALRTYFAMMALGTILALIVRPRVPMEDITYFKTVLFYPLYYFLFYYAVRDLRMARQFVIGIFAVAVIAGLEAWSEAMAYGIGSYVESHRAAGPFGPDFRSANRAGVFYSMFIPLLAAPFLFLRKRWLWRLASAGGALVLAGAVLFTYSRQSYFITLLGLALLTVRRSAAVAVLALAGFLVALPYLPEGATQRVEETQQVGQHGEERFDESTESRWEIWTGAVQMWSENPLGIGLNRFKSMIGNYCIYVGKDAHNFYVLTLAESGLQGLASLLFLMFAVWRLGGSLIRAAVDDEAMALGQGFRVAALGMALGNIYGSPFTEGAVMGIFWALAGVLERYAYLRHEAVSAPVAEPARAGARAVHA
ncbi:O-antigen ligase family protein [Tahibacter amnicola]|uniref:O-antigen ligase family protein n=1 Tax=Tahibacter amnicola TaxID=2976241 RepID=A0ABY6B8D1_9GAMM|nr:O-antigen ligase family protein [Tahibacter amnicola]UXI66333.1 O-antigen ligase family protein [Tahibacter amnicola]